MVRVVSLLLAIRNRTPAREEPEGKLITARGILAGVVLSAVLWVAGLCVALWLLR